jgi:glycosyltransferase involved in cell wall biosynthesis
MSNVSGKQQICIIQLWPLHHHHFSSRIANIVSGYTDVTVIGANNIDNELYSCNVNIIQLPIQVPMKYTLCELLKLPYYILKLLFVSASILRKHSFTLFHIVYPHPCAYLLPLLYDKSIPVISDRHDIEAHPGERNILRSIFDNIESYFQHTACVHSRFGYEKVKNRYSPGKCFCIPHGDFNFISKTVSDTENETSHVVLFFGRVLRYKGIETLIESIPQVIKAIPDVLFIFAGSGEWEKYDREFDKIPDKNRELHKSYIPDSDVSQLFIRSNIVILPYYEASQSGVIPFAAAYKRCVLATRVGGIPEVIYDNETGLLIEPKNSKALTMSLIRLLKDPHLRMHLAQNLNTLFETEFSYKSLLKNYIEMYDHVLKEKESHD